ncbi:MAG: hypothetical protein GX552_14605 [Chloroflexi bacterium]|nr:hypothetical protein [Chloroflexota bacterium]
MSKRILWLLLLLGLLLTTASAATAQETAPKGTLTGQVVNGTEGGESPGGLEVTVWAMQNGERVRSQVVTADAEGRFAVNDLDTSAEWTYLLQTTYQDVTYAQGPLQFEAGQAALATMLPVYETTTDDANIVIERVHLIFSEQERGLAVAELYVFTNTGDCTYIGQEELDGKRWTSRYALPENSRSLSLNDGALGERFLATADGFVDREPLWPGRTTVMFRYALDATSDAYDLARAIHYPIMSMNVLLPDTGLTLESADLQLQGKLEAQGERYWNYIASDLAAGHQLDLTIHPAPSGAAQPSGAATGKQRPTSIWQVGVMLLGGGAVGVALAYPFWQQRRASRSGHKTN